MGCQSCSAGYLNLLNSILLLGSLVILGYSAFLAVELGDFNEVISSGAIVVPAVFAGGMLLVSVLGLVAVTKRIKICVFLYLLSTTVVTVAVLGSGAALLAFSGVLDEVENKQIQFAEDTVEAELKDFGLALFNECCALAGEEVVACSGAADETACFTNEKRAEDFAAVIPEELCEFLEGVVIDGAAIVGTEGEECGGNNADQFVSGIATFIEDNIKSLGITNLVLAVVMLLDLFASCVVLWTKRAEFDVKKEEPENVTYNNQTAPEVAQGQEIKY